MIVTEQILFDLKLFIYEVLIYEYKNQFKSKIQLWNEACERTNNLLKEIL